MNSREKQDLIDEFGPVDASGQAEPPAPEITFEFEPDTDPVPESAQAQNPEIEPDTADEPIQEPLAEKIGEAMFDFIGAEESGRKDQIGFDPVEAELADTKDKLLRIAAEFENFKKRRIREKDEQQKYANERLLKDLLPVLDNLERALDSTRQNGQAQNIVTGLDLVTHEFLRVLSREGVEPVRSVGKPFDPAFQEALQSLETPDAEPGTVVGEILRGYTIYGRVLRAALVVVAREPQRVD